MGAQLARFVALLGAASFFLWMFLAVAPLETLADSGGVSGAGAQDEAYRFAADWRHGMAGNSPLYMPGFFVLAVAAWVWSASSLTPVRRLVVEGGVVLAAGYVLARISVGALTPSIVAAVERATHLTIVAPWPAPPWRAGGQGLYTAAVWMAAVAACRRALARRSFAPLLLIPPMTIALVLIRPWTVDDFVALWITRAAAGDLAAIGSAVAIPIVAWCLVLTEWSPQWVHSHRSRRRTDADQ